MTLNVVFLVPATTRGANVLSFIGNYSQPASSNIAHMWNDIFIFTVCLFIADNKPKEEGGADERRVCDVLNETNRESINYSTLKSQK